MAPVKPTRTYSRKNTSKSGQNVISELKVNKQHHAIKKRKKKKKHELQVEQLHVNGGHKSPLWNNSVNVTVNDTFDKLLKGEMCRSVVLKENVSYYNSDSTDVSKGVSVSIPASKKQKRKKQVRGKTIESTEQQQDNFADESVHTSLEVQKCNLSSLYRYNNMTIANENCLSKTEHNSEIVSPKICSTPIVVEPARNDQKLLMVPFVRLDRPLTANENCLSIIEHNSEIVPPKICSTPIVSSPLSVVKRKLAVARNDQKLLMVPFVRLDRTLNNCMAVMGVETGSVSISRSELFEENDGSFAIKHSTPLRDFQSIDKDISHSTPVSFVNKRRRGRVVTTLSKQLFARHAKTDDSVRTEDVSELLSDSLSEPQDYITLRNGHLIMRTKNRSDKSRSEKQEEQSISDKSKSEKQGEHSISDKSQSEKEEEQSISDKSRSEKQEERSISDMFANSGTSESTSLEIISVANTPSKATASASPEVINISSFSTTSADIKQEMQFANYLDAIAEKPEEQSPELINKSTKIKQEIQLADNLDTIVEKPEEQSAIDDDCFIVPDFNTKIPSKPLVALKPGKSYRRSLSLFRRSSMVKTVLPGEEHCALKQGIDCDCVSCTLKRRSRRTSVRIVPVVESKKDETIANEVQGGYVSTAPTQEDQILEKTVRELSISIRESLVLTQEQEPANAREIVLRKCAQTEPLPFAECYPDTSLQHCQKIGEGVYGEVFLKRNASGGTSVMKVIPIEGTLIVNGDRQKKFEEILSEIIIALALSDLRYDGSNQTSCFSEVQQVRCVQGRYPDRLLELWELYNEVRQSENDSPEVFGDSQLFIVLELANGGTDLESFVFANAQQCYSVFKQVACALAIAENALFFEHRDLHWGNILISHCDKRKNVNFILANKEIEIPTCGVEACIIDFTLSRITYDGVVVYNDLAQDEELFTAEGDYQFEVYRLMQEKNGNDWQHFQPYTNVLWLHYVLNKMLVDVHYSHPHSKVHRSYLMKFRDLKRRILNFDSVKALVTNVFY